MSAKKPLVRQPAISADMAEKIRNANLANLIKKVKSGKTLTAAESKLLERAAMPDDILPPKELITTGRLAELFRINRKTIAQWRKENRAGVPDKDKGKEDVSAWRAWFAANPSAGNSDGKPRLDRETLLCEKLEVEIEIKKLQRDEEKRELIRVGEVRESIHRNVSAARSELIKMANDLPPRLAGLSESKIQSILRESVIELLTRLSVNALKPYEESDDESS